ncbi:ATP-binding protein [Lactococcus lactis]|uniref:ATP-binding protein n=1 Tax=Lactococcus lactis TaxID=1358 RepID=UPI001E3FF43E|nr:ATP-binding protein [Lactococcus lactis]
MTFNITSGPTATAQKVVLYGVEGIGKSTFASQFPSPIFIDTEGSTSNMNVQRLPKPTTWQMLMDEVDYVKQSQVCQTLIIDTADWADYLCQTYLCAKHTWESIESPGYGQGYVYVREEFGRLLNKLSDLTEMGINIILTAHTEMKKEEKADEFGKYDHYQLKMSKYAAALVKEWADMVLFANFETTIITDSKTKSKKAVGGNRVLYTTHHPAWDAKNRHGLPDKLPLEFGAIAHIFQSNVQTPPAQTQMQPTVEQPQQKQVTAATTVETPQENNFGREPNIIDPAIPKELAQLMSVNEVTEEEIRRLVADKGYKPYEMPVKDYPAELIQGGLVAQWDKIYSDIKAKRAY